MSNSSGLISLFSERQQSAQRPYTFVLSILAHAAAIALVSLGFLFAPRIKPQELAERYSLRRLDLHMPEPQIRRASSGGIGYPGPQAAAHSTSADGSAGARAKLSQLTAKLTPAPQTLVQPDLPPVVLPKTKIPTVVMWAPAKTPPKAIVPPPPVKLTAAQVQPSIAPPNVEVNLADLEVSSTKFEAKVTQPILPSTSSPVVVHGPDLPQQPPQTTSVSPTPPTPTAVLSLSDIHMKEGRVMLPPANETAEAKSAPTLDTGHADDASKSSNDNPDAKAKGEGTGHNTATNADKSANAGNAKNQQNAAKEGSGAGSQANAGKSAQAGAGASTKPGAGSGSSPVGDHANGARTGAATGAETGSDSGSGFGPPADRITLPRDGQYGSVVVGSSLVEKYPETAELWSGRLSYTVYLHVGLPKSWILQYSLPRATEHAGNISKLEAPWPYNIVRPYIGAGDINADALMVHGVVNTAGRFEELAVVFPPEFPGAKMIVNALQQWQFRPAAQGGQNIPVEVLLIIPEVEE